jgi:hypothetical protein
VSKTFFLCPNGDLPTPGVVLVLEKMLPALSIGFFVRKESHTKGLKVL